MNNPLKSFALWILDRTLLRLFRYLYWDAWRSFEYNVQKELLHRSVRQSADYADSSMQSALVFGTKKHLWDFAISKVRTLGLIAEFGVYEGLSINYFARSLKKPIFGFDSFEGLQEDWQGWELQKGHFDLAGRLPKVEPNVTLIKGWFDKTVPSFLQSHPESFSFVHIDCDTYDATKTVLNLIGPRLTSGTVIVFDEYFGYRGWQFGEFKAWKEFISTSGLAYEYLGFSSQQVAIRIA